MRWVLWRGDGGAENPELAGSRAETPGLRGTEGSRTGSEREFLRAHPPQFVARSGRSCPVRRPLGAPPA